MAENSTVTPPSAAYPAVFRLALESIRTGAPGLSAESQNALARGIALKVDGRKLAPAAYGDKREAHLWGACIGMLGMTMNLRFSDDTAELVFHEDDLELVEEEGRTLYVTRLPASEVIELRQALTDYLPAAERVTDRVAALASTTGAGAGKHPLDSEAEQMRLAVALTSGDHETANEIYGRAWYVDVCRAEQRLKEFVAAGQALLASLPDHWHDDATVAMRDLVEGTDIVLRPGFFTKAQQEVAFREYGAQSIVPDQSPAVPASPRSGAETASPPAPAEHGVEIREDVPVRPWRFECTPENGPRILDANGAEIIGPNHGNGDAMVLAVAAVNAALSQGGQAGGSEKGKGGGKHRILEAANTLNGEWAITIEWPDGTETVEIVGDNAAAVLGYVPEGDDA